MHMNVFSVWFDLVSSCSWIHPFLSAKLKIEENIGEKCEKESEKKGKSKSADAEREIEWEFSIL